jgi:branched-chain amino acid transport system ATP-binding protein
MLDVTNINSGYGVVPILRDVSFSARAGEISLIVGENGAGKSTLLRTIAGFIKPQSGSVIFDGAEISALRPEAVAMRGARLVLDGHRIFPGLSVWDNIRLGATIRRDRKTFDASVEEAFSIFPILKERLRHPASSLSGGQQQMLALAQAFVGEPKLLMCDEPSLGLAQNLMPPIFEALRTWAARGMAVIVVEQYVDTVLPYADKVIVLDRGRVTTSCDAREFASNRSVQKQND